jgi:hypothetical protein
MYFGGVKRLAPALFVPNPYTSDVAEADGLLRLLDP